MKLVVGLGNPGRRYQGTRHNVGYLVVAELARRFGTLPAKTRFQGEVVEAELGGQKALLLSPTTFMNLSGVSVQEAEELLQTGRRRPVGALRRFELAGGQAADSGARLLGRPEGVGRHHSAVGQRRVCAASRGNWGRAGRLGLGRLRPEPVCDGGTARD